VHLNYERRGAGSPLVLIHGIAHRWQAWEPVLDALAAHHDVIAIDLPGFGLSPRPATGMPGTISSAAASLGDLLTELGLDHPHVAGNSLGGGLALELAAAGRVASATAISPAGFASRREELRAVIALTGRRWSTYAPVPVIRAVIASPRARRMSFGAICRHPEALSAERALGDALAMRRGKGFLPYARALRGYRFAGDHGTIPVTIAWGTHDRVLVPGQAARARERLTGARHVWLDGCGHVPMGDDPDAVAAVILATTGAVPVPDPVIAAD